MMARPWLRWWWLALCAACAPAFDDRPFLITGPTLLAVTSDPPEVSPGGSATMRAWVVDGFGVVDAGVTWAACVDAPSAADQTALTSSCLAALDGGHPTPTLRLTTSADACLRFGPSPVSAGLRGRDLDSTGGVYQPIALEFGGTRSLAQLRLTCPPVDVSADVAQAWALAARPNQAPDFVFTSGPVELVNGAPTVLLSVDWTAWPEETFPLLDPGMGQLGQQTERYDVSWYVTAGTVATARTSTASTRWVNPQPGVAKAWAVLRDSRGAMAVHELAVSWP